MHAKPRVAGVLYSPHVAARAGRVSAPEPVGAQLDDSPQESEGFGFPREARLLDGAAFTAVFRRNRRLSDRYWTLLVCDVPEGGARLGLAIAKKRARRAHDRNRIKRVARESFRLKRGALGNRHVVLMNRDAACTATPAELRAALEKLWGQLTAGKARS